ncbi:hypothetical protein ACH3XW_23760 [Acanthocheilonema viteae]
MGLLLKYVYMTCPGEIGVKGLKGLLDRKIGVDIHCIVQVHVVYEVPLGQPGFPGSKESPRFPGCPGIIIQGSSNMIGFPDTASIPDNVESSDDSRKRSIGITRIIKIYRNYQFRELIVHLQE